MTTTLINCTLHLTNGDQSLCHYYVQEKQLNANKIIQAFPYEGNFHFRVKVSGMKIGLKGCDYLWLDLENTPDFMNYVDDISNLDIQLIYLDETIDETCSFEVENYSNDYLQQITNDVWNKNRLAAVKDNTPPVISQATANNNRKPNQSSKTVRAEPQVRPPSPDEHDFPASEPLSSAPEKFSGPPPMQRQDSSSSAIPINVNAVKKGATNLWKAMKATATNVIQNTSTASSSFLHHNNAGPSSSSSSSQSAAFNPFNASFASNAAEHLASLTNSIQTEFSYQNSHHVELLKNVWDLQIMYLLDQTTPNSLEREFPFDHRDDEGAIISSHWKLAGWQNNNIIKDLKTTGLLALECNLYFGQHHHQVYENCLLENKANIKTNYPFAIVSINLTLLLIELFQLRDYKYKEISADYWEIFEDGDAFYEVRVVLLFLTLTNPNPTLTLTDLLCGFLAFK
jgi:hypothetical protein